MYAPVWWKLCFVTPYGEKRAYAPESCSVSILRPRIQPSFVTASAISMCQGARVDEQRNSSSRVQRHFTGPAGLQRGERGDRLGRGVDLAAEAAADGAADELELVQRQLEVRGDDAHREVERLRAGVDRQPAARLGHDERDLRLHRHVLDRGRAVDARDDRVGLRRRRASMSPLRIWRTSISASKCGYQLPQWWTCGASGSAALRMSKSAGRSSRSSSIASTAACAVSSSSAATARSAGPCSGPRPWRAAARRRGCRAPRGARRRGAGRPPR